VTPAFLRVVCSRHDRVIGRVVPTDDGPTYLAKQPVTTPGRLFKTEGGMTRDLSRKRGRRLPEVTEDVRVLLSSEDAERYTFGKKHWGTLPAFCERCGANHWIGVEVLRRQRGVLLV
jgi:hypothetical protein